MKLSTGLCFPSDDGVGRSHEGHSPPFPVALPVTYVAWDSFALHAIHKGTVAFPFTRRDQALIFCFSPLLLGHQVKLKPCGKQTSLGV